jgi:two-component system, NarL family, sensor kinase
MNKLYLLSLCLTLLAPSVSSQQTIIVKKMADSCMILKNMGNLDDGLVLCEKMIPLLEKLPCSFEKGNAYRIAGNMYLDKYEYEKAEQYYSKAFAVAEKLGKIESSKLKAIIIFSRSLIFCNNSDYETALKMCIQSENFLEPIKDTIWLVEVYNRIAGIYEILGQKDKFIFYSRKASDEAQKSGDPESLFITSVSYANFLEDTGDTLGAINQLQKSLKLAKQGNFTIGISVAYFDLGFIYADIRQYEKALQFFRESYKWAKSPIDQCSALIEIGRMYYHMKKYTMSIDTMLCAISQAEKIHSKILERNIYEELNLLEIALGNFNKAHAYLTKYVELEAKVFSEQGQQQVNFLEAKYKSAQREAEINRLQKENELKSLKIKTRTQLSISLGSILVLSILLFVALYGYRQRIAKKDSEIRDQKIRELEKEKLLLATQSVLKGVETERQRLARDLHDGLGGLLFGVKLSLTNMKGNIIIPEESVKGFDQAITMLDTSIIELRRVAHNMMPETLIKFGLKDTLADYCESLKASYTIDIKFQFIGQFARIDQQLEINSFRILQELIGNAIKHSGASEIIVQMIQEPDRLCLITQDNGIGFDIQKAAEGKGIGLNSVRSRVESMKGIIYIQTESGKGTEINAEFHL